jgi:hypothetical protein
MGSRGANTVWIVFSAVILLINQESLTKSIEDSDVFSELATEA